MESVITYSIKTIKLPPSIWKVLGSISGTPPDTHPNTDPSSTTQHGKQLNQGMVIWFCQAMFLDTNINTAHIPSSSLDFNTQGLVAQSSLVLTMPGFPNLSHPNSRSSVCTESVSVSPISMLPFFTLLSQWGSLGMHISYQIPETAISPAPLLYRTSISSQICPWKAEMREKRQHTQATPVSLTGFPVLAMTWDHRSEAHGSSGSVLRLLSSLLQICTQKHPNLILKTADSKQCSLAAWARVVTF